jgi:hypothetical protein
VQVRLPRLRQDKRAHLLLLHVPRVRGVVLEVEGVRSVDCLAGGGGEEPCQVARLDMSREEGGDKEQECWDERGGGEEVLACEGRHCSCLRLGSLFFVYMSVTRAGLRGSAACYGARAEG